MLCANPFKLTELLPLISPFSYPRTPSIFRIGYSVKVHTTDKQNHVNVGRSVMSILLYGYMYSCYCSLFSTFKHSSLT